MSQGPAASFAPDSIRQTLLLMGDAGAAQRDDAVLVALRRMANEAPRNTLVGFLGDNLYEAGLPSGDGPLTEPLKNVLRAQLWAAGSARAFFVAGNHDWGDYRNLNTAWTEGSAAVVRQATFIARESGGRALFLPAAGCAGPTEYSLGDGDAALRIIAIDSEWWLTALEVPPPGVAGVVRTPGCTATTTAGAAVELQRLIAADTQRPVIVVAHHPLASNGRHGHPLFWWPFNAQDIPNRRNARFRTTLADALNSHHVLLYASGHDHDLELFNGPGARFTLVSGAGSASKVGGFKGNGGPPVVRAHGPGFTRIDVLHGGRITLRWVSIRNDSARLHDCVWLAPEALAGQRCDQQADVHSSARESVSPAASTPTEPHTPAADTSAALALDGEGLRVVRLTTGSTRLLPFGEARAGMISIISRLLSGTQPDVSENADCRAMVATWPMYGLQLWFAPDSAERFIGWSMARRASADSTAPVLTTMSGIGLGSTRKDLESAYQVRVTRSSLGMEFSAGGIAGILASARPNASIQNLWAGQVCLAR